MGKRLNVRLDSNPTNGTGFLFSVNVVSEYTTNYFSGVFKTTPVNADDILIGVDANASATNLLTYLQTFTVPAYLTFSRTGNTVHCDVEPDNSSEGNINITWSGTAGITYEIINTNVDLPLDEIKSRSPYLYIKPEKNDNCGIYLLTATNSLTTFTYIDCATNNIVEQDVAPFTSDYSFCAIVGSMTGGSHSLFSLCGGTQSTPSISYDTINYYIRTWNGDILNRPSQISYTKNKQKVVSAQNNIYINLSNLVKEKLEGDIDNYVIQNNPTQSQNIGINESKWVSVEGDFYKNNIQLGRTFSNNFFVIDGYTEPGEDQGLIRPFTPGWPQRVLLTDFRRQYTQYAHARIHFKTKDLLSIDAYVGNVFPGAPTPIPISFVANPDISNEYIQSILVDTTQDMTYSFNYSGSGEYIWTNVTENCKYENYDVVFKNKWGVLETICFSKKSVKSLSVEDSNFLRGIVDYNGDYNISRHTRKHFNTIATEELVLNTDFLPEYMNDVFKELMFSEEIWLVDRFNTIKPINKTDAQFTYKTSLNDKLIQYTMKVKLSHNIINNIL